MGYRYGLIPAGEYRNWQVCTGSSLPERGGGGFSSCSTTLPGGVSSGSVQYYEDYGWMQGGIAALWIFT